MTSPTSTPPVFGLAGWHNAGKTTLMERLIAELHHRGLTVSTIKHAHHSFDVDQPGKDSYRHRSAGAQEVLVASAHRWALMHELRGAPEPTLAALIQRLSAVDLVLVEGFKTEAIAKLEIVRAETFNGKLLAETDATIVAAATDDLRLTAGLAGRKIAILALDDIAAIADCVIAHARPLDRDAAPLRQVGQ